MSRQLAWMALAGALGLGVAVPAGAAEDASARSAVAHPTTRFWRELSGAPAAVSPVGALPSIFPVRFRAWSLERTGLGAWAATAPAEGSAAARQRPLVIALPDPQGGFQRFELVDSPVMEPGLADQHPDIRTYAGRGLDDPSAQLRMDVTPLGFHASVRSTQGSWYIDPYYHLDDSVYVSYYARHLKNQRPPLREATLEEPQISLARGRFHAADTLQVRGFGFTPGAQVVLSVRHVELDAAPRQQTVVMASPEGTLSARLLADPERRLGSYELTADDGRRNRSASYQVVGDYNATDAEVGPQLRTYRLALLTDPAYATYFGGSANVTAAKVTLINRVTQVYEAETSIRLVLVANNDRLNLDTAAQMTGANGPCGGSACFSASQTSGCSGGTLSRNRQVIGLLIGAGNFDIGHIALGVNGGGLASLGVVGRDGKAQGCTGIPTPVGDFFAVDYVAHEMGHQFAGNHTFNGAISNCSGGNRSASNSVEPGSGSSVMAYAGICGTDNLQSHSDPYWSQRSFDEIVSYTSAAETKLSEVQMAVLTQFSTDGQQFRLRYKGADSVPIVRGSNYSVAGVKAAIEGIAGWPAGATVTVSALSDTTFTVGFGGSLAGIDADALRLVGCSGGCTGYVSDITAGGQTTRGGVASATQNSAPVVSVKASYTIPLRTPFALTGRAADAESDTVTYLWEQTDRGGGTGTGLISNTKVNGPLFRQFGTRAVVTAADTLKYNSPGENSVTTDPTRIFPDLVQLLAGNTNAQTGFCPPASTPPTSAQIDCFSEFLPNADYVGLAGVNASPLSLHFKLTARDGHGGVGSGTTTLLLATGAGPFKVTSQDTAVILDGASMQTVTWAVANTDVAPVNAAKVKISLSVDGGLSFPYVLAAKTSNDGKQKVVLPNVATSHARIKVEAVGNVFFDISKVDFTIQQVGG